MAQKYVLEKQYKNYNDYLMRIIKDNQSTLFILSMPILNLFLLILFMLYPFTYIFDKWKKVPLRRKDIN
jgi:hypothetical protein